MTNKLFVAWRSGGETCGHWGAVGRLEYCEDFYRFVYTRGAKTLPGFRPFPGMEDLEEIYESNELLPLFTNRLLNRSRPEYDDFLRWGGFDPNNPPDPITLLGVMGGRRVTDSIEVFPCPAPDADGCYITKFFVHGMRWIAPSIKPLQDELQTGDELTLMLDVMNPYDPHAVAIRTNSNSPQNRRMLGYVPRYLARDFCELCQECSPTCLQVTVEQVNTNAPLQHRLLCRFKACWPENFQPCQREEFQPLVTPQGQQA